MSQSLEIDPRVFVGLFAVNDGVLQRFDKFSAILAVCSAAPLVGAMTTSTLGSSGVMLTILDRCNRPVVPSSHFMGALPTPAGVSDSECRFKAHFFASV